MFRFLASEMLIAYRLVPALIALAWWAHGRKSRDMALLGDPHLLNRLTATVNRRGRLVKTGLLVAAVGFLVTALARPQFGSRIETVRREGQDILIALDLSASMIAEDMAPNRLDKAKFAIADLISRLDGDRVGLVAFAGEGGALGVPLGEGTFEIGLTGTWTVDGDVLTLHPPEVTELLGELSMTKMLEGTTLELGWAVHAHPSLSEMVKEAALSAQGRAIHM